ncbi:MAG: NAD(P)-dependent oxidoreductase [Acidimicrobiia bacterium]|nr:NAD(P)-dependent oxidoreductase [Acidimicrobiia bacterium]
MSLTHLHPSPFPPPRVVVIGAGGFIGGAVARRLEAEAVPTLRLGRPGLDLLTESASAQLAATLRPDDAVVFASAKAPCKDLAMLRENLIMAEAVCGALAARPVSHVVYISSDAVYKDSPGPLTEASCAEPGSLHGVMHLAREVALRAAHAGPLALVRPTLVYGLDDPHNGYGPNRFRRMAAAGTPIVLFGEGEERRDHVDVEDVAELVCRIVLLRSDGVANAVSGEVASFRDLAEFAAAEFPPGVPVTGSPRRGPMPHNGYRPFDNSAVLAAFPGFRFRGWREGLRRIHQRQQQSQ